MGYYQISVSVWQYLKPDEDVLIRFYVVCYLHGSYFEKRS